ncbi:MAG: peroxiredoxin [Sandaracinaceae bacterium]
MLRARDHRGNPIDTDVLRARGPVVVYFYPKDFTPGCTQEACLFRDAFADLDGRGASLIGVSSDDDASHVRFAERYGLPFSLVSDPDHAHAKAFDAMRILGLFGARRITYVIDRDGIIRAALHHELSMRAHVEGVERAIAELVPR